VNTCPRDRRILASNDVNGYRYYSCEQCGGTWIPGAALDRVLSARGVGELNAIRRTGAADLFCPDCHALCDAVVIEGCGLDVCPRCRGVWLDAGEVQRVKHLFPDESAVVDADMSRGTGKTPSAPGAVSVVELVGNLIVLLGR